MARYVQTDFLSFILANICAPLLSVLCSYLQMGMTAPPGSFRWLCMLEQIPCCLWSPYSSFLHFSTCMFLSSPSHFCVSLKCLSVYQHLSSKNLKLNADFWMGMQQHLFPLRFLIIQLLVVLFLYRQLWSKIGSFTNHISLKFRYWLVFPLLLSVTGAYQIFS